MPDSTTPLIIEDRAGRLFRVVRDDRPTQFEVVPVRYAAAGWRDKAERPRLLRKRGCRVVERDGVMEGF